ncbi:MAG: hypothetical protein HYR88_13145 [Verrucomicrobia bacterium]|nr:hypothetical protein [Verrucomicrobiota bacterium]MBI3871201.1 hypothetical protein [Verrucomicrobiota bacterium]
MCFGQQPCGFFPRRYLFAKIQTALRLQSDIGGEIVFFYHDSDHDPRETRTTLRHRKTGEPFQFNFAFENQAQRKFSPLYLKRVRADWRAKTALQLPAYVDRRWVEAFQQVSAGTVADFCLDMYRRMGLIEGVRVARSSDAEFRRAACDVPEFFVDAPYEGEIARARFIKGELKLHKGGDSYETLPPMIFAKEHISPTRDTRLRWMQSVLHCTHYIAGAGEQAYLSREEAPEITYINRDPIDRSDEAYADIPR